MPKRGGKRPGAGRKPGSATKRSQEIADKAAEQGITPLEYMLEVLRTPIPPELKEKIEQASLDLEMIAALSKWHGMRFEAAKYAAPYMHPRLQTTTIKGTGEDGGLLQQVKVTFVGTTND